jgi:hypothetical protein
MRSPGAAKRPRAASDLILRNDFQAAVPAESDIPRASPNLSQVAMPAVSRWDLASRMRKRASHLRTRTSGWDHLQDWAASRSNLHLNPARIGRGETATTMQRACDLAPSTGVRGYRTGQGRPGHARPIDPADARLGARARAKTGVKLNWQPYHTR